MDPHYSAHPGGLEGPGAGHPAVPTGTPTSTLQLLTTKYIKHSKSVSILWGIFTVCSAILNIVVFLQDEWVGETSASKSPGHFGLWRFCTVLSDGGRDATSETSARVQCVGRLDDFASILSPAFRAATVFVGISVIVAVIAVMAMILFCCMKSHSVFEICGTMQMLSGVCMTIGVLCFPAGWDNDHVRGICGSDSEDYKLGNCGIRWAFVLAAVAILDTWILGCLAFTLSHRHAKPIYPHHNESQYISPGSIYKGEINGGFIGDAQSLAGSRKSLNMIQPVVMMPHPSANQGGGPPPPGGPQFMDMGPPPPQMVPPPPDVYAEFRNGGTRTPRQQPPPPAGAPPYGQPIQNFQL